MTNNRPNVLLILTDDQRFDTIHALGNLQIKTPNLDLLCEEGTAFTHAHIPSGTVGAICMPSRAMLNTGRTLFHLEQEGAIIPSEHKTMPETFRANGYTTFGVGKWHNGPASYASSFDGGDEIFFGGMWDHWNVPTYHFDPAGQYDRMAKACIGWNYSNVVKQIRTDHMTQSKHSTDLFSDVVLDYLDQFQAEKPFFLYLAYMAPHDPRTMPAEYQDLYKAENIDLPPNFSCMHFDYGIYEMRDEQLEKYPRDPQKVKRHIADYYAIITHLDNRIGKILDKLKEKNLYDNTIIVFAGDNGLACGQHSVGKTSERYT